MTTSNHGTVLLAEICGVSTLANQRGYEEAFRAVRASLGQITATAQAHQGSVDDGFGDWLLTTFDISSPAADGPHAALLAALEMREQVAAFARASQLPVDFSLRIGVDLGPVICGGQDEAETGDFAVMGEAVRGATDLKNMAPQGRIYVDPDTYRATRDAFVFRDLDETSDPRKTGWLPAHELLAARPSPAVAKTAPQPSASAVDSDPRRCIHSPWAPLSSQDALVFAAAFYFPSASIDEPAVLAPSRGLLPELLAVAAAVFGAL